MKNQLPRLTLTIALLVILSSTPIQSAAELPVLNIAACTTLWNAAKKNDLESAKQALNQGAIIDMWAEYGNKRPHFRDLPLSTPLRAAAMNGNVTLVTFLLKRGANANAVIPANTPSLLLEMCTHQDIPRHIARTIVRELITYKADVNAQHSLFKYTPLWSAIHTLKDNNIARQLILAGADVSITDKDGKTALDMIETHAMYRAVENAQAAYARIRQANVPPHYHTRTTNPTGYTRSKPKKRNNKKQAEVAIAKEAREAIEAIAKELEEASAKKKSTAAQKIEKKETEEEEEEETVQATTASEQTNDTVDSFELDLQKMETALDRRTYRKLFNALSLAWHPDKVAARGANEVEIQQAQENFTKISQLNEQRPLSYFKQL